MSTTTERTDINDDDAWVFVARNLHDYFGLKLADYERIVGLPDWLAQREPIHGCGAGERFVSVPDPPLADRKRCEPELLHHRHGYGTRVLVNDPADVTAVKAYRDSSVPDANAPYVADASPSAGSEGNSASAPIDALIVDLPPRCPLGMPKLFLNDAPVTPQTLTKGRWEDHALLQP